MTEHVILVALSVEIDGDVEAAQRALMDRLVPLLQRKDETSPIIEWWIAEDERYDGSDLDSAVFIPSRIVSDGKPILSQREAGAAISTAIQEAAVRLAIKR